MGGGNGVPKGFECVLAVATSWQASDGAPALVLKEASPASFGLIHYLLIPHAGEHLQLGPGKTHEVVADFLRKKGLSSLPVAVVVHRAVGGCPAALNQLALELLCMGFDVRLLVPTQLLHEQAGQDQSPLYASFLRVAPERVIENLHDVAIPVAAHACSCQFCPLPADSTAALPSADGGEEQ